MRLVCLCLCWFFLTLPASAEVVFSDRFDWYELPDAGTPTGTPSARHLALPLGSTGAELGYYQYLPPGYDRGVGFPLLLFIHGLGENGNGGSELNRVLRNGPPRLIEANAWDESLPFVVLSPQNARGGCMRASDIRSLIDYALREYKIDPRRIYLTGLSCGAIGSWNFAGQEVNQRIAALVPIAGDGRAAFNNAGCDLGRLPIWAFHGDSDGTVSAQGSIQPIESLQQCTAPGAVDARLTLYEGVGHNSWRRTYDLSAGHDIYAWMLAYRRPVDP
jgi:predicted peptidase